MLYIVNFASKEHYTTPRIKRAARLRRAVQGVVFFPDRQTDRQQSAIKKGGFACENRLYILSRQSQQRTQHIFPCVLFSFRTRQKTPYVIHRRKTVLFNMLSQNHAVCGGLQIRSISVICFGLKCIISVSQLIILSNSTNFST